LQFLVSTGRHHGFESLEEQRLLPASDFVGNVVEVLPQPFRLCVSTAEGRGEHTPDFLAVFRGGGKWLFDVRPVRLAGEADAVRFAAADEAALACGRHRRLGVDLGRPLGDGSHVWPARAGGGL
jgi:hypothetical protein